MQKKYVRTFIIKFLAFKISNKNTNLFFLSIQTYIYELIVLVLYYFRYAFSSITFKIQNIHNKSLETFAFCIYIRSLILSS